MSPLELFFFIYIGSGLLCLAICLLMVWLKCEDEPLEPLDFVVCAVAFLAPWLFCWLAGAALAEIMRDAK